MEEDQFLQDQITDLFPYKMNSIQVGFKYFGFFLKPNGYCKSDWCWLLKRIDRRISKWAYRFLSLGGRIFLVSSVLQSILVNWTSVAMVPISVLELIRKIIYSFIWLGKLISTKFHMVSWSSLCLPKNMGGWGVNINIF